MITTYLSLMLATAGIILAMTRKEGALESVSEIAYVIPKWAFTLWIVAVGGLLMPDLMEHLSENWQWTGFLCVVGLFCVAASPYYKTESKVLHFFGGWMCGCFATAITAATCWPVLFVWLCYPLCLLIAGRRFYTFWAEYIVYYALAGVLLVC